MSTINFLQGPLSQIAQHTGEPISFDSNNFVYINPSLDESDPNRYTKQEKTISYTDGALFFGLKENNDEKEIEIGSTKYKIGKNRFYLYLDQGEQRHVLAAPFDASLSLENKNLIIYDLEAYPLTTQELPFLYANQSDVMDGQLTMKGILLMDKYYPIVFNGITDDSVAGTIQANGDNGLQIGDNAHPLRLYTTGQMSLDNDKVTLGYNDRTQSLDFTFA